MKYRLPNGATLDGPAGLGRADLDRLAVERGLATPDVVAGWQAGGQKGQLQVGMPYGLTQAALQGPTFGFGDEAQAALTPGDYQSNLARLAQEREAFSEQNRLASAAATLGGSLLGGAGLVQTARSLFPKAVAAIGQIPAWASYPAGGAITGAVTGAGSAAPGERLAGAGAGALVGGTLGAAFPVSGHIVRGIGRAFGARRGQAANIVIKAMINDDIPPDQIAQRLQQMGPEAVPADLGENLLGYAQTAAQVPGPFRNEALDFLRKRSEGQAARVVAPLDRSIGAADIRYTTAEQMKQVRQNLASPLYEQAYSEAFVPSPKLQELLKKSSWVKLAWADAKIRGSNLEAVRGGDMSLQQGVEPSLRGWNAIKKSLDDRVTSLLEKQPGKAREVMEVRDAIVDELDNISPIYKAARSVWGGTKEADRYMKMGGEFFNKPAGLAEQEIAKMTQAQKDAFTIGFKQEIQNRIERMGDTHDITRLFNNVSTRRKLEILLPPQQFDEFMKTVEAERRMQKTYASVHGSQTMQRQQFAQEMSTPPIGAAIADVVTGHPLQGAAGIARSMANAISPTGLNPKLATEVGRPLMTPAQMLDPSYLPYLQKRQALPPLGPTLSISGGLLGGDVTQ